MCDISYHGPIGCRPAQKTEFDWTFGCRSAYQYYNILRLLCLVVYMAIFNQFSYASLSCCSDKLITSFKVCSESKYTEPATNVSAKTGVDVMNNAMITNGAASDNFVCVSLTADATNMRSTCITSSRIKLSKILKQKRQNFGFSF